MIKVYVDDSADEKQQKVVVAGAFMGRFTPWCDLKNAWNRRLRKDGLRYFRSTEYYSLRGEFERYRDPVKYPKPKGSEAAKALRDDLDAIINNSDVMGVALAIPIQMYQRVRDTVPGASEILVKDAFEMALQSLILECAYIVKKKHSSEHLAFFCDEGPSSQRIAKVYATFKKLNPDAAQILDALVHLDDKKWPQLQAADLMAHLARELVTKKLEMSGGEPKRLYQLPVYAIKSWDEEYAIAVVEHELERRKQLRSPLS